MRVPVLGIIVVLCGILLAGCNLPGGDQQPTVTLIPTLTPHPTATQPAGRESITPVPPGACRWQGTLEAWEDTNGNAAREPGEPPLEGVIAGIRYKGQPVADATFRTEANGAAALDIALKTCDLENYRVVLTQLPEGYALTTQAELSFEEANEGGVLHFGLKKSDGATALPALTGQPVADGTFNYCSIMSREQAESVLGPLAYDPTTIPWNGGGQRSGMCIFKGSLNTADVAAVWFIQAEDAKNFYVGRAGEIVSDVGDGARWDEGQLLLSVLHGNYVFSIHLATATNARDQATRIGGFAVVRVP